MPITAGALGIIGGNSIFIYDSLSINLDSHIRYLSGILLAIGLMYWFILPDILNKKKEFTVLTILIVVGGLFRLIGAISIGVFSPIIIFALIMELIIAPSVYIGHRRIIGLLK